MEVVSLDSDIIIYKTEVLSFVIMYVIFLSLILQTKISPEKICLKIFNCRTLFVTIHMPAVDYFQLMFEGEFLLVNLK